MVGPKRYRGPPRHRFPPSRKVIMYGNNRESKNLKIELGKNETIGIENENSDDVIDGETSTEEEIIVETATDGDVIDNDARKKQIYDENYSIHSYRLGKDGKKSTNYEIYESVEDDEAMKPTENESGPLALERKARKNFDLFTAREANKVYTLSNAVRDSKKPKYHFEINPYVDERQKKNIIFDKETPTLTVSTSHDETTKRKPSDPIPVYETEVVLLRQKRNPGKLKNFLL